MLGFVAAIGAELATGKTIFEQTAAAPGPIAFTFALFAIATLVRGLHAAVHISNCNVWVAGPECNMMAVRVMEIFLLDLSLTPGLMYVYADPHCARPAKAGAATC